MKKTLKPLYLLALLPALGQADDAVQAATFGDAISEGKAHVMLRYRFEHVDQDGKSKNANASTLLTRLNYLTKDYNGWQVFLEADNVSEVGIDDFNAGMGNTPNRGEYPIVADPSGTEVNQAWVQFKHNNNKFKLGRQRIVLDNQRFVGGVAWRQNEQTYDSFSMDFNFDDSRLFVAYIDKVHRIFGDDVAAGNHDNQSFLINYSNKLNQNSKLGIYHYNIDNENAAAFSTATTGAFFEWGNKGADLPLNFKAEFAQQSDNADNPVNYTANYYRLDAGIQFKPMKLLAGYEVLTGDANKSGAMFRTPLATLHAFNGWADQFLNTPQAGIEDAFIGSQFNTGSFKWQVLFHDFNVEDGSSDLGNEVDLSVAKKLSKRTKGLFKIAHFDGKGARKDVDKVWFMLQANF
ncbi:alginate export family protein [Marinicella rhabdoformis]|uniref:alginate export family protein n=1 Tax=Marinicella rhabdoformis TaxID=2580566 RepID=UPI0012AEC794|nr:alginate export family protein [Marinicella rhabdoformis]